MIPLDDAPRSVSRKAGAMITVDRLTRTYGGFKAVDDISFIAQPGRVTGFLGPNGAGKTTTMRIMVGLTAPTHGTVTVGGHAYKDIPNPGRHVGVLLDASAQHAGRTGREVLTIGARTMGLPDSRVEEMLALVSLTEAESGRRVRNYSLGMRQRLGIAHALLGDPQVLILDEPANGLDPAGIRWMRGLLKGYAERGGTVLLSSHLLNEVQLIADDIIMIGRGKIVAQGTPESLLADSGTFVRAVENEQLAAALEQAGIASAPHGTGFRAEAEALQVGKVAAANQITLVELRPTDGGLEDLFLELTADAQRDDLTDDLTEGTVA
jgi:ABC-2 type transport system ATP-binding protein